MRTFNYWCIEFTDKESGLITETGNETTFTKIVVWVTKNLDNLPKGEGKIVRKSFRKR